MITLRPGQNHLYLTTTEKFDFFTPSVSTYNLYYILKVVNQLDEKERLVIIEDYSAHTDRYNQFPITVIYNGTQSNPLNSEIDMIDEDDAQYLYEVWACDGPVPTSPTFSIPFGTTYSSPAILERGRLLYTIHN